MLDFTIFLCCRHERRCPDFRSCFLPGFDQLGIIEDIGRDLAYLMVPEKPVKFHFTLFNESSLDLDGYVWFRSSDWFTMRASRSRFNEEVLKRFNQAGLSIAYPSRSVYIERNAPEDVPQ